MSKASLFSVACLQDIINYRIVINFGGMLIFIKKQSSSLNTIVVWYPSATPSRNPTITQRWQLSIYHKITG